VAPVANMEVQSASVETFGLKMTQELDIMFSIACTLQSFNFVFFRNFKGMNGELKENDSYWHNEKFLFLQNV
jgi:hypothetical protein